MSEYWVSKKKYFCKYCEIYIADDAPSRQHHENGLRHKGNLERFIRGIYKTGEKRKKDLEEEKREMARVEQAANAAFAQDIGAGLAKPTAPVASSSSARRPAPRPSNPYANYSTAESLGYTDPDAEKRAAELELRRSQGVAGEWQIVSTPTPAPPEGSIKMEGEEREAELKPDVTSTASGEKRSAEAVQEDEDGRSFKIRKKTLNTGLGEIYDPGLIPIKVKKREGENVLLAPPESNSAEPAAESQQERPKWTPLQLKPSGESSATSQPSGSTSATQVPEASGSSSQLLPSAASSAGKWAKVSWGTRIEENGVASPPIKSEEITPQPDDTLVKTVDSIKAEPSGQALPPQAGPPAPLFKKRKAPSGAARGRRPI